MPTITIDSTSHTQMINIDRAIENLIPKGFTSGVCHLFTLHTTSGLTVNENGDPNVVSDMNIFMKDLIPWINDKYEHSEGNTAAHLKSTIYGPSLTIPIENGRLTLGTWQSVYFCEFDVPRNSRKIIVKFITD